MSVVLRWRRSRAQERLQLKWLAYVVSLTIVAVIGIIVSGYAEGGESFITFLFTAAAVFGVGLGVPVAVGIAIFKHRLYDIDVVINRTLVYGSLTVTLVALYLGGIATLQRIFVALTGQESTFAIVASTLAIAALFNPLRRRIQSFIDRRFYRRKYDARKTLEAFSAKLRDETDLEALNDDLIGVVRETMQPAYASLWLRPSEGAKTTK